MEVAAVQNATSAEKLATSLETAPKEEAVLTEEEVITKVAATVEGMEEEEAVEGRLVTPVEAMDTCLVSRILARPSSIGLVLIRIAQGTVRKASTSLTLKPVLCTNPDTDFLLQEMLQLRRGGTSFEGLPFGPGTIRVETGRCPKVWLTSSTDSGARLLQMQSKLL